MKEKINKLLKPLNVEVHGKGYIEKLKNQSVILNEYEKFVELLSGKAKVVFDVGSNRGDVTTSFLEKFQNIQIHAFEPFEQSNNIFIQKLWQLSM